MRIFIKTLKYYKKYLPIHIFCIILGLMRMVIMLVEPQIISLMVDRVINPALGIDPVKNSSIFSFLLDGIPDDQYMKSFIILVLVFAGTMALYFAAFYARWNISHFIGLKSENRMRQDAFDKINRDGSDLLKNYSSGELITVAGSDTGQIKNIYIAIIPFLIDCIFYIIIASYFLYAINWIFVLFPLFIGILFILLTKRYIRITGSYYGELWEKNTALNTLVQEGIYGIRIIKSAAQEKAFSQKFEEKNRDLRNFYYRFGDFKAKYQALYSVIQSLLYLLCMALGIALAINLQMTSGEFISFLSYLLTISGQFIGITYLLGDFQNGIVSGKRFFEFMNKETLRKKCFGKKTPESKPDIEVIGLTARKDGHKVLDQINLSIPYGKKIGIMGNSGCGKSVLIKTLQGMTEYEEGRILLNGSEMHVYSEESVSRLYSYAMQDVFLFSDTIASNIAFYNPETDRKKIVDCAKAACADDFVSHMPEGYESVIGEKGFGLSGGQKQRVAIARALLKNAPILLLDDCTSALDGETERKIFSGICEFYQGRTQLIATHRAFAVRDADEILFMEHGRILERGTHHELMKLNGKYAAICRLQNGEVISNG